MPTPVVAPSLLAANHGEFIAGLRAIEEAGLTWVHLDIMDGHFVPNISFGPQVVADLRPRTKLHFDVHLMLTHPDRFVAAFAQAGAERLTVHIEAEHDMGQTLAAIKAAGLKAGIAMNPAGDPRRLLPYLDAVDLVLCMTVFPGFGGQAFIPAVLESGRWSQRRDGTALPGGWGRYARGRYGVLQGAGSESFRRWADGLSRRRR
jgi:ribulose-phosphate 3-epimerase